MSAFYKTIIYLLACILVGLTIISCELVRFDSDELDNHNKEVINRFELTVTSGRFSTDEISGFNLQLRKKVNMEGSGGYIERNYQLSEADLDDNSNRIDLNFWPVNIHKFELLLTKTETNDLSVCLSLDLRVERKALPRIRNERINECTDKIDEQIVINWGGRDEEN